MVFCDIHEEVAVFFWYDCETIVWDKWAKSEIHLNHDIHVDAYKVIILLN